MTDAEIKALSLLAVLVALRGQIAALLATTGNIRHRESRTEPWTAASLRSSQ
jgi:hypothetical protein